MKHLSGLYITFALVSILFYACSQSSAPPTRPETIPTAAETTEPTVPDPTVPEEPTEVFAEATEPVVPLGMDAGSYQLQYMTEDGKNDMDYYLFVPENAVEGLPLVIFLHGDDQVGRLKSLEENPMITKVREIYGENYPFLALSPCTRVQTWIREPVTGTVMGLIRDVAQTYRVDPERIILTGHSRGSVGVWHLINEFGDYFSAAVTISSHCWSDLNIEQYRNVPVRAFCGDGDELERHYFRMMSKNVAQLKEAGFDAEITEFVNCGHAQAAYDAYTSELFDWMLSQ